MQNFSITVPLSIPDCNPIDIIKYTMTAMNTAKVDDSKLNLYKSQVIRIIKNTPKYNLLNCIVGFSADHIAYCNIIMNGDDALADPANSNESEDEQISTSLFFRVIDVMILKK